MALLVSTVHPLFSPSPPQNLTPPSLRPSNIDLLRRPHCLNHPDLPEHQNHSLPLNRRLRIRDPSPHRRNPQLLRPSRRLGMLVRSSRPTLSRCYDTK